MKEARQHLTQLKSKMRFSHFPGKGSKIGLVQFS
jgi:hypothetical protein